MTKTVQFRSCPAFCEGGKESAKNKSEAGDDKKMLLLLSDSLNKLYEALDTLYNEFQGKYMEQIKSVHTDNQKGKEK
jgi:hypothetical protein